MYYRLYRDNVLKVKIIFRSHDQRKMLLEFDKVDRKKNSFIAIYPSNSINLALNDVILYWFFKVEWSQGDNMISVCWPNFNNTPIID